MQVANKLIKNAYQSSLWFDERSILSVHLVVEAARVAQIVAVAVASPQRS